MTSRFPAVLALAVTLAGCPDPYIPGDDDVADDDDSSCIDTDEDGSCQPDDCDDGDPSVYPGVEEACNGVDDDCDGLVDEDHLDSDGDGIADCVDGDCEVAAIADGTVTLADSCPWTGSPLAADPWDVVVEWSAGLDDGWGLFTMPAVGHLVREGVEGQDDIPEIVYTTWNEDHLRTLRGDGSAALLDLPDHNGECGVVLADVDRDGDSEIVTVDVDPEIDHYARVQILGADGSVECQVDDLWVLDYQESPAATMTPTVADLDRDGIVEIIVDRYVIDATWCTVELLLDEVDQPSRSVVVADLDEDGTAEIILGDTVFSHTGDVEWLAVYSSETVTYTAVVDVDGDGDSEVVFVGDDGWSVHEADGQVVHAGPWPVNQFWPFIPCAADVDGDGLPEIAFPSTLGIVVMEADGTWLWHADQTLIASSAEGCSAFDFDLDGRYEILHEDHETFFIYDGQTGEIRFRWNDHNSRTGTEYPIVADVDGDGSAEIVLPSSAPDPLAPWEDEYRGITVLGHREDLWPPAGPTWAHHDHAPLRIRTDGTVESPTPAFWRYNNMFRARPPGDGLADLTAVAGEVCIASCDHGPVKVSWGAANQGHADTAGTIQVALYADHGGTLTLLAVQNLPDLRYGTRVGGVTFEIDPADGGDGIRIVVDDDGTGTGTVDECNEDNNVWEIPGPICP